MSNESDSVSLKAELQPGTARLGDLLTLTIQASHTPGLEVQPPSPQKEFGTFEVYASTSAQPSQISGAAVTEVFQYQLQNFTTGQQLLPALRFSYRGSDNKVHVLKTPELKVTVEKIPPGPKDKGDIRGIKGVLGPVSISPWWWLLLVFAVVVGAICLWRERKKKEQGPPPPPPVPPDETALEKLRELLESGWVESGKLKEFYSGLSDTVRAYIENGFGCPALERTTGELLRDLRKQSLLRSDHTVPLKTLLEECDLVKFAKFRPDPGEALKAHTAAVKFVEATREDLVKKHDPLR